MQPTPDQIEVVLLGPGYGECALVHLGNGCWVIIDSCIDTNIQRPAALSYLHSIGVNPKDAVRLILATHWHDDHIRGLSNVISECTNARFCCSAALRSEEFLATVLPYQSRASITESSGVSEIFEVYRHIDARPNGKSKQPINAIANRRVFTLPASDSGHGVDCEVWTLSPSDKQISKFHDELTALMPSVRETKRRIVPQGPNHLSVVTWINIGEISLLFGGDLEETKDKSTGWSVIVSATERPIGRATVFKIPHHGSANAHNDDVWRKMVIDRPYAILSPYNRGAKLPSVDDVKRITGLTPQAFSTTKFPKSKTRKIRSASVDKMIRETVGKIRDAEALTGWIRLRNGGVKNRHDWTIALSPNACPLDQIHK